MTDKEINAMFKEWGPKLDYAVKEYIAEERARNEFQEMLSDKLIEERIEFSESDKRFLRCLGVAG